MRQALYTDMGDFGYDYVGKQIFSPTQTTPKHGRQSSPLSRQAQAGRQKPLTFSLKRAAIGEEA
ncbi:MAG: hypothetical protein ABL918_01770 [Chakrabartia sp.]